MSTGSDTKMEYRQTAIIAGAMMATTLIYAVIVEILRLRLAPFGGFTPQSVAPYKDVLLILPLIVMVGVKKARDSILKKNKAVSRQALIGKLKTATIVTFALCEIPAICGLVLFLAGGLHNEFYIFLACSIAAMVVYFPRYALWESFVRGSSGLY